ncbi:glycosyltransferase family 4 protein [Vibrio fluvialis]|nr:glycosyltransferase family 4 protein [Vibrio fluvialis]MBY7800077.1 glycosyltransferase family 4 protein [Vibrio fluvialis]MBY8091483.1 glycosyltransferase family 4 protein [Vibrio fluvialis]MBY8100405.1 glycosyltransferase family 4 protein [Vibrio fluvialis]MBY8215405.1 glycosyltransferase family 4 protein [Vibrio fluvialis]
MCNKKLVFIINVDWYFRLHWIERALYFQQQGYEIHVATFFSDERILNELEKLNFICHDFELKRKSINVFSEIFVLVKMKKLIFSIDPSLIHCVTVKPNIYVGFLNRLFFNKPIIFSVTGLGAIFSSKNIKFKIIKFLVKYMYRYISTTTSKFIFENNDDFLQLKNEKVLRHDNGVVIKGAGIDLTRFYVTPVPFNQTVLFAARLLKDKGLFELIEARRLLMKEGVRFTLKVAGLIDNDVSSAISISEIEKFHQAGDIEWLGSVADMPSLIQSCDIVSLPTQYGEGVPRILIEAAACGRAIVATDVVGCREIVTPDCNGELVEPGNVTALARALLKLLNNKVLLSNYGEAGRLKVENEFSQEMVFEKTHAAYRELLGR